MSAGGQKGAGALLTREQFVYVRDEIALASMLERGRDLEVKVDAALADVRNLRKELAKYPAPAGGLQYNVTKEQFDERIRLINVREKIESELDAAWRLWANLEAMIGDIERDQRYVNWAAQNRQKAVGE